MALTKKMRLFIEAMSLAFMYLDEMITEEQIQEEYGSDFYAELKRFCSYEWRSYL